MILDAEMLFSNAQSVAATTYSQKALDLGGPVGGSILRLFVHADTSGTGGGTFSVTLESSADGESYTAHYSTAGVEASSIEEGERLVDMPLPADCGRWVRLNYTINGTASLLLTSGLVLDTDTL